MKIKGNCLQAEVNWVKYQGGAIWAKIFLTQCSLLSGAVASTYKLYEFHYLLAHVVPK